MFDIRTNNKSKVKYINDDQLFENNNSIVTFAFIGENVAEFFPLGFENSDLDLKIGAVNKFNTLDQEDYKNLYIIGLGTDEKVFDINLFRNSIKDFLVNLNEDVNVDLISTSFTSKEKLCEILVEEFIEGKYQFKKISKEGKARPEIVLNLASDVNLENIVEKSTVLAKSANITKQFVNMPSNILVPNIYVEQIKKLVDQFDNLTMDIKKTDQLKEEGYGLIHSVNQGSQFDGFLVTLEYANGGDSEFKTLVGKGITFDTGGLSLKTGAGLQTMKADMGGSATALGVILGLCELNAKVNCRVILGITENSISAASYLVDSVLISKVGKTVEVLNTDAEGRLVLADLIGHAQTFTTDEIISLSTLTGSNANYFGSFVTPIHATNIAKANEISNIATQTNENTWVMPLNQFGNPYLKSITSSTVADLTNISKTPGCDGIIAGVFLNEFVTNDNIAFTHIDLAGQAFDTSKSLATGKLVKTLIKYLDRKF